MVRGLTLSCENGKSGGLRGLQLKFPLWWGSGYFLETHNGTKTRSLDMLHGAGHNSDDNKQEVHNYPTKHTDFL